MTDSEPTGNVIDSGGIYISHGIDEDGDDIVGVAIHGHLPVITTLGLLVHAAHQVLTGQAAYMEGDE